MREKSIAVVGQTYNGCQWPAVVEKEPAFVEVFSNLASFLASAPEHSIDFKLTAYEPIDGGPQLNGDECGLILFPHGMCWLIQHSTQAYAAFT